MKCYIIVKPTEVQSPPNVPRKYKSIVSFFNDDKKNDDNIINEVKSSEELENKLGFYIIGKGIKMWVTVKGETFVAYGTVEQTEYSKYDYTSAGPSFNLIVSLDPCVGPANALFVK